MQNRKKITSRAKPNKPNNRRQPDNVLALKFRREAEQKWAGYIKEFFIKHEQPQAELISPHLLTNPPRIKPAYMFDFTPSIPL